MPFLHLCSINCMEAHAIFISVLGCSFVVIVLLCPLNYKIHQKCTRVSQNKEGTILFDGTLDLKGQVAMYFMIYKADHAVTSNVIPSFQHIIVYISGWND